MMPCDCTATHRCVHCYGYLESQLAQAKRSNELLTKELERLQIRECSECLVWKAELEKLRAGKTQFCALCESYAKDRDFWKGQAEKLAEGLRATLFAINHHGKRLTKDFSNGEIEAWERYTSVGKEALSAYRDAREGKGSSKEKGE